MQERRNSIANALELRLPCTNPSIWRCFPQLNIVASDQGSPEQTAQVSITVAVQRDQYLPVIRPPSGNTEINVNTQLNVPIVVIQATDEDLSVSDRK